MRLNGLPDRGFTLIELMISLAIFGLLLLLGIPNYLSWLSDSQISNAAESVAGGLRYAQAQAVNQNEAVRFVLNPATGSGGWVVMLDAAPNTVFRTGVFSEGADKLTFTPFPAGTTEVTYNGLGRIVANTDASVTMSLVTVTYPAVANSRTLWVLFGNAGANGNTGTGIKVCLPPPWPRNDTMGCPA